MTGPGTNQLNQNEPIRALPGITATEISKGEFSVHPSGEDAGKDKTRSCQKLPDQS